MPELSRPDATLHYEISGDGPPLVMIAGFMSDSASWAPLLPLLEPHFSCIRLDNRSCGQTQPWDAPTGMQQWTDDILALLDHLGHSKAHFVGHSLGGVIGWALAAKAPDRFASLLMMGSAPILTHRNDVLFRTLLTIRRSNAPEDTWLRVLFPWLFRREAFADKDAIAEAVSQSLAYPFAQSADAMEHQLNSLQGTDPTPFQAPPPVPTRAILSTEDILVPVEDAKISLTGIDTRVVHGLGHSLHWDDPDGMAQEILNHTGKNRL